MDPATGNTGLISVGRGETITDIDAGIAKVETASLSGRYFCDVDGDDLDDGEEPGIEGAFIVIRSVDGTFSERTQTDSDGFYFFDDLAAGEYVVEFAETSGKTFVAPNAGEDDSSDSDVDPVTGMTGVVLVEAGDVVTDIDAGVAATEEYVPEADVFLF